MYMVNVYLPEQSSLCPVFVSLLELFLGVSSSELRGALGLLGVWVLLARASSLALLAQSLLGGTGEDLHICGSFLAFPTHLYGSQSMYTSLSQTRVHLHM